MSVSRVQEIHIPIRVEPAPVLDIVKKVAIACLKELAIALAMGAVIACFTATAGGLAVLMNAVMVQLAVSVLFHSLGAYASVKVAQRGPNLAHFTRLLSVCEWMTGYNFAIFSGFNMQALIHESGHAMAAIAVYNRPRPFMQIHPFLGGATEFLKTSKSSFGKMLSPAAATCLIVASGPICTLLVSSALLAIGLAMKEKHPQFGKYLVAWGLTDFINHAYYAFSALYTAPSNFSHDFVRLAIFGLNPAVAAIGIIAVPILITAGMHWWPSKSSTTALA